VKEHRDGSTTYYHQMLAAAIVDPDLRYVIPLAPEPIIKQDGSKKNDCERNAAKRLLQDLRRERPHFDMTIIEDSLASNAPHIKLLRELNFHFILGVKPGDHTALMENIKDTASYGPMGKVEIKDGAITNVFHFINNVPLNNGNHDVTINYFLISRCWNEKKRALDALQARFYIHKDRINYLILASLNTTCCFTLGSYFFS
jgi:hypothetical protein